MTFALNHIAMSPQLYRRLAISTAAALMFSAPTAQAVDMVWSGGSGNWADATSWISGSVPDTNSDVLIDNGNPLSSVVELAGAVSIRTLVITADDSLRVLGGASFAVQSGSIINSGTLSLAGNSTSGHAYWSLSGNTTLAGNGNTVLSTDGSGYSGYIFGSSNTLTVGSGHTLRGAGYVGDIAIVNQGTVLAEGASQLYISANGSGFDNSAGLVQVAEGGTLNLSGTLTGGTLQSLGQGTLIGGVYQNLTLSGSLKVAAGSTVYAAGTLTNTGALTLAGNGTNGHAQLYLSGNTSLAGSGNTVLSADGSGYGAYIYGSGNTLTVGSGHTLRGAGYLGAGDIAIVNQGTVRAEGSSPLYIQVNSGGFDNTAGLVQVADGGTLQLSGTLTGGTLQSLGQGTLVGGTYQSLALSGSLKVAAGSTIYTAGTLTNTGTLTVAGNSTNGDARLYLLGNTTLAGSGSSVLGTDGAGYSGYIYGGGNTLVVGSGHTLRGGGYLGAGDITIVNQGTVRAEGSSPLYIQVNSGGFDNTAGLVQVADGGTLQLSGTLTGGTLQSLGQGTLVGGTYQSLALSGSLKVAAGSTVYAAGTLTNTGTLTVAGNSTNGDARLYLLGNTTLAGSGSSVLGTDSGGYSGYIYGGGNTLAVGSGHTLRGAGYLGVGDITIVNQGTVRAEGNSPLHISVNNGGFDNTAGLVQVADGGTLQLSGTLTGGTLQSLGQGTLVGGTYQSLALSGSLKVAAGSTIYTAGTLTNSGTLSLAGNNTSGHAYLALSGNTILAGSGNTVLSANGSGYGAYIYGSGNTLTVGSGHTLRGAGYLGVGEITIVNQGTVRAEGSSPLYIQVNSGGFDNTAGLVQVADGGTLQLSGTLTGGTLQSLGQGTLVGGTYQSLALSGSLKVAAGSTIYTAGTLTNSGTLSLAGNNTSGHAYLALSGNTILAGSGNTVLSADGSGYGAYIYGSGNTLAVGSGHTLRGAGYLGGGDITIVNQGAVLAEGGSPLHISVNSGGFDNTAGTLEIASDGSLVMSGDLLLADGSALVFDISGTTPGSGHGTYSGSGQLTLDGLLTLRFTGYTAQVGDSFTLLTSTGSFSGQFDSVLAAGYTVQTLYDLSEVTVTVTGVTAVPEPATYAMWLAGLAAVGIGRRLRSRS